MKKLKKIEFKQRNEIWREKINPQDSSPKAANIFSSQLIQLARYGK
jgi:hypothetical protein